MSTTAEKCAVRKRKAHTKSRQGCCNCKLRRVKCDEGKPHCQKCVSFAVQCEYGSTSSQLDLAPFMKGAFQVNVSKSRGPQFGVFIDELLSNTAAQQMPTPGDTADGQHDADAAVVELDGNDRQAFERFRSRTVWTIGTAKTVHHYHAILPVLAMKHWFLMHMCLTLTLRHDRFLMGDSNDPRLAESEASHWYEATRQFNDVLSTPVKESQKDALWATAALLGAISFSDLDATCAEEAWPLKQSDPKDLEWLRMSEGKMAVWKLTDPLRPSSEWRQLDLDLGADYPSKTVPQSELSELQANLFLLCGLDFDGNGRSENPYAITARMLANLLAIDCNGSTILRFLNFNSHLPKDFRELLGNKDPRALLVLAMWYAKVIPWGRWWLQRRSNLECQAIVIYLDKNYHMMSGLQSLLAFPRKVCGLARAGRTRLPTSSGYHPS